MPRYIEANNCNPEYNDELLKEDEMNHTPNDREHTNREAGR